ncbi:MAG: SWIB/MDM2 domain-containing protein, partial [Actinomycetota bacterium]|nr:SWIB/MDM2 domain-containing protein [Actinomycetota bacterium]
MEERSAVKSPRVLRVRVKTEHGAGDAGSFRLRVEGDVLPSPNSPQDRAPKMSSLLKKACVHLDKAQFGDDSVVTWTPSSFATGFHGFQVEREAARGFEAKIELHLQDRYLPPAPRTDPPASSKQLNTQTRYRVGKLQPIVGSPTATVPDLLARLWEYINSHRLRERESNEVKNDTLLKEIFGVDKMVVHELRGRVTELLKVHDQDDQGVLTIPYQIQCARLLMAPRGCLRRSRSVVPCSLQAADAQE